MRAAVSERFQHLDGNLIDCARFMQNLAEHRTQRDHNCQEAQRASHPFFHRRCDLIERHTRKETETGEKFEDNALPWDSINAATYVKSGDMTQFGPELLKQHEERIAKDPVVLPWSTCAMMAMLRKFSITTLPQAFRNSALLYTD
jgi:hypothetical protein